jgi:hypothetical protein
MLHLVVATHGLETCAALVPAIRERVTPHLCTNRKAAEKPGIGLRGSCTDMPGHATFMLLDAPNAHAVTQLMLDVHLMDWNAIANHSVMSTVEALQNTNQRSM